MKDYDSWLKSEKKCFFKEPKKSKKKKKKWKEMDYAKKTGQLAVVGGSIILLAEGVDALAG